MCLISGLQAIKTGLPSSKVWETSIALANDSQRAHLESASGALHNSKVLTTAGEITTVLKIFEASCLNGPSKLVRGSLCVYFAKLV